MINKGGGLLPTTPGYTNNDICFTTSSGGECLRLMSIPIAEEAHFDALLASGVRSTDPPDSALFVAKTSSFILFGPLIDISEFTPTLSEWRMVFNQPSNSQFEDYSYIVFFSISGIGGMTIGA